jgi:hypothetical protein
MSNPKEKHVIDVQMVHGNSFSEKLQNASDSIPDGGVLDCRTFFDTQLISSPVSITKSLSILFPSRPETCKNCRNEVELKPCLECKKQFPAWKGDSDSICRSCEARQAVARVSELNASVKNITQEARTAQASENLALTKNDELWKKLKSTEERAQTVEALNAKMLAENSRRSKLPK